MEQSRRLQLDPVTNNAKLEIVEVVEVKRVLDEVSLNERKVYLEEFIAKSQASLDEINSQLEQINHAKSENIK